MLTISDYSMYFLNVKLTFRKISTHLTFIISTVYISYAHPQTQCSELVDLIQILQKMFTYFVIFHFTRGILERMQQSYKS